MGRQLRRTTQLCAAAKMLGLVTVALAVGAARETMQTEMQAFIDNASSMTGYSFSVGYHDGTGRSFGLGAGPRTPPSLPEANPGTVSGKDTMLLGSGTKPFTAAAVLRLVDQHKVALDDRVMKHIDPVLTALNGTTFVQLFGPLAAKVTVGQLLSMQSGIADFDIPDVDNRALVAGRLPGGIFDNLYTVAAFPEENGCNTYNCTWVCEPGTCVSYSSTSYILAGLVLLAHAPPGQRNPATYDQFAALGLHEVEFRHTHFLTSGAMNASGLTVAGLSLAYGEAEMFAQDASILGFTCGNVGASAHDIGTRLT